MDVSPLALIVDARGNPLGGTFGSTLSQTNILGVATGAGAGMPVGGLDPSQRLAPLAIDAYGALTIRPGVCATSTATSATPVATGTTAGKNMLSVFNGSATTWQRVAAIYAQCPPQINTQGGLLGIGSGTSYTQILFGLYRITGHSGGTPLTPVCADPADDAGLDANYSVRVGATVTGIAASPNFVWDAAYNGGMAIGPRPDLCMKVWTMPPNSGLVIRNTTAIGTTVGFVMSITCAQNIA